MSIYDGVKLRHIVFHTKKEKVRSKLFGDVEAFCLESATPFSTFGDKEGIIRIWYTTDGKKTPLAIELDLPIGNLRFELEEVKEVEGSAESPPQGRTLPLPPKESS